MFPSRLTLISPLLVLLTFESGFSAESNLALRVAYSAAQRATFNGSCVSCLALPDSMDHGIPKVVVPLTSHQMTKYLYGLRYRGKEKTSTELPFVLMMLPESERPRLKVPIGEDSDRPIWQWAKKGPLVNVAKEVKGNYCLRSTHGTVRVGTSVCTGHTYTCTSSKCSDGYRTLEGIVWGCGGKAFRALPPKWLGTCYLGYLTGGVTIHESLDHAREIWEHGIVTNKTNFVLKTDTHHDQEQPSSRRRRSANADECLNPLSTLLTQNGGNWEKVALFLFPSVASALVTEDISTLAGSIKGLVNSTSDALSTVAQQLSELRNFSLDTRLGVDILFSQTKGLCNTINLTSCCFTIPDRSKALAEQIDKIREVGRFNSQPAQGGYFDLWEWMAGYNPTAAFIFKLATPLVTGILTCALLAVGCKLLLQWVWSVHVSRRRIQNQGPNERYNLPPI